MKSLSVTFQMKATEQYFPVTQCNILFKLVLTIEFLDKILVCNYLKTAVCNVFFCRDESEVVIHSDDAFAPVGFLQFKKMHLEDKEQVSNLFQIFSKSSLSLKNLCRLKMLLCY